MYKSLMKKAAIALILVSAAAVQAATFNIGALGNTYTNTVDVQGTFEDVYTFNLPGSFSGVTGGYLGFDFDGSGLTTFLTVGQGTPGAGLMVSLPINSTLGGVDVASYQSTFSLTPGGSYWFKLSGSGDLASYTVTLAPVPEPETYALLLAGLGLMGAVARRRQSK